MKNLITQSHKTGLYGKNTITYSPFQDKHQTFLFGNTTLNSTTKNEDYVDTLKEDDDYKDKVEVEEVQPGYSYSKLNVNFIDTNNSDLSKIDLMMSPINISFTCQDLGLTKTVVIDSVDKLNSGIEILVNKDATWNYLIDNEALIFDNFRGSFTVKDDTSTITFPYYYLDNFTIASVGLNPIGTIDSSLLACACLASDATPLVSRQAHARVAIYIKGIYTLICLTFLI